MFEELLALVGDGPGVAVRRPSGQGGDVPRSRLADHIRRMAAGISGATRVGSDLDTVWVGVRDPYLMVVATIGCLHRACAALVEPDGPPGRYDALAAAAGPPSSVLCDDPGSDLARWAHSYRRPVRVIDRGVIEGAGTPATATPARADVRLRFFTSGTTGPPTCVGVGAGQLFAAIQGVARRLALTPADTSLSVAPLTHTLGLVTTVLAAVASGGSVCFADLHRPREFFTSLAEIRPTWCAASPSAHQLAHRLLNGAGRDWPGLRLLRSSSASMPADVARQLEGYYGVPVVNAYAMTEAPGEIASQAPDRDRRPGTVGRPTLCEVEVRSGTGGGPVPAGTAGEIWIRGPNVAAGERSGDGGWFRTGDIGWFDEEGYLRLTGRVQDVINQGGWKIWPPEVEAAALADPSVAAAVAFPVPHAGLGETVGLAVVPAAGCSLDRAALRRHLMTHLPRYAWPSTIVVCAEVPRSPRGKTSRHDLWRLVPGIRQG